MIYIWRQFTSDGQHNAPWLKNDAAADDDTSFGMRHTTRHSGYICSCHVPHCMQRKQRISTITIKYHIMTRSTNVQRDRTLEYKQTEVTHAQHKYYHCAPGGLKGNTTEGAVIPVQSA